MKRAFGAAYCSVLRSHQRLRGTTIKRSSFLACTTIRRCGRTPLRLFNTRSSPPLQKSTPPPFGPVRPEASKSSTGKLRVFAYLIGAAVVFVLGSHFNEWANRKGRNTRSRSAPDIDVYFIVLTGGPCGGKSTALAKLKEHFIKRGFVVYVIPEIPTLLFSSGVPPISEMGRSEFLHTELNIIRLQLFMEQTMQQCAQARGKKAVVLCDRGAMDISAYLAFVEWQAMLHTLGIDQNPLLKHYSLVIHLVTAANGAEKFYTTANNQARTEGLELARQLDDNVKKAWSKHPHVGYIDNVNSRDFSHKMERMCEFVDRVMPAIEEERARGRPAKSNSKEK